MLLTTTTRLRGPTLFGNIQGVHRRWLVCFSAALFFLFEFMQVNIFNAITPSLMKEFSLSAAHVGQISANYFYATLLFVLPAGMILDRLSSRKVILVAMASSVISTYFFSLSSQVWMAEVSRFVTGLGGSFCFISCIRLASRWFSPKQLALVVGLMVTMAMLGGMIAQTPMTVLTDHFGWRTMLVIDAALGCLMFGCIYWIVQDYPLTSEETSHSLIPWKSFFKALSISVFNLQNWLAGTYTSLLNLPVMLMGALWGSLYLVQVQGVNRTQSSLITSMIFIGMIIGSPLIGWLSDRVSLRRLPMIICAILSLIVILIIILVPHLPMTALFSLFFALGFFSSGQILSYPLIAESNPKSLTGTSEGIASMLIMAGGITQPLFGILLEQHWDHKLLNNVPLYSYQNYEFAMSIIPIAFIISLIAAFFIKETHCKSFDH